MHNERDAMHDECPKALTPEAGLEVPSYLIYFGMPLYLAAIVISSIDPMAGPVLLAVMAIMVITLKMLSRLGS
jgi:hypothetical protein